MTKTITIGLVALAFVAGSILTGTMAYASGDKNGQPFEEIWNAIHVLETSVANITTDWLDIQNIPADIADGDDVNDADSDPTNELQTWTTLPGIPADIADGDDVGSISCNWIGTKYLSHGWDFAGAFSLGMRVTCASGEITDMQWVADPGNLGEVRD